MDDKWFKKQQKRVGITADDIAKALGRDRSLVSRIYVGRQPMKPDEAKVFAKLLDVPISEILSRAGVLDPEEAQTISAGFTESDAAPWIGKPSETQAVQSTAASLGGEKPGIDIWTVKTNALVNNGYLAGDHILVDTHQSERCRAGDAVIAQVYDWQTGTATTLLRRFEPPVLVSGSIDPSEQRVHVVDGNNVVIMGKIIASWRT